MNILCPNCKKVIPRSIGDHQYIESGLDNVFLRNITLFECKCGVRFPSLFRVGRLNDLIAEALTEKTGLLSGKEIKYLRKNLHYSSIAFSTSIGVGNTTLSKWENSFQAHSEQNDRLIRYFYLIKKGIEKNRSQRIVHELSKRSLSDSYQDMILFVDLLDEEYSYSWQEILLTTTKETARLLLPEHSFMNQAVSVGGAHLSRYSFSDFDRTENLSDNIETSPQNLSVLQ